jgi:CRP-like cAMP-binding protein
MAAAQGVMKQSKSLPDGRLLVTGFRFAGEPLPYRDAGQPWDVDIEAVTASVVCRIAVPTLARLREVHPQIDRQILAWAQREISVANEHMLLLGLKTPVEKVATFLLELKTRRDNGTGGACALDIPMGREDIGNYLGVKAETVSRTLSGLARDGVIAIERPSLIVLRDQVRLKLLANGGHPRGKPRQSVA